MEAAGITTDDQKLQLSHYPARFPPSTSVVVGCWGGKRCIVQVHKHRQFARLLIYLISLVISDHYDQQTVVLKAYLGY